MTEELGVSDTVTHVEVDYIPGTPVDVPGTSRSDMSSTAAIPGASSADPSTPHPSTDRLRSLGRKRTRTRSVVLKPENSKKLIEAQESTAAGLLAAAAALEKSNQCQERLLNIQESLLEIETRNARNYEFLVESIVSHLRNGE